MTKASQQKTAKPEAVIFDLDGLMIDTETLSMEAWKASGSALGYEIGSDLCIRMMGTTERDADLMLRNNLGESLPIAQLRASWRQYIRDHLEQKGINKLAGLDDLLAFLDRHSIPRAIATSSSGPMATLKLNAAKLSDSFKIIITGDKVTRGKPEPDIFLAAAKELGSEPIKCMVLEDSEQGILAASRARMRPVMVPGLKTPSREIIELSEAILPDLGAVQRYIQSSLS